MEQNVATIRGFVATQEHDEQVSLDPSDPGNWSSGEAGVGRLLGTKYGISAPVAIAYYKPLGVTVTQQTMRDLTSDIADAIFQISYLQPLNGQALPSGIDLATVDMGFNAGVSAAGKLLQEALGFAGKDVDGWIGAQTLAAAANGGTLAQLDTLSAKAAKALQGFLGVTADGDVGPKTIAAAQALTDRTPILLAALCDRHLAYYRSLSDWSSYSTDWTRRTYDRLTAGLALMAAKPPAASE